MSRSFPILKNFARIERKAKVLRDPLGLEVVAVTSGETLGMFLGPMLPQITTWFSSLPGIFEITGEWPNDLGKKVYILFWMSQNVAPTRSPFTVLFALVRFIFEENNRPCSNFASQRCRVAHQDHF